ncbi:MAG: stress response translation initiation inhibitor YciH [Candidatus Hadarchaeota archaeon]
MQEICKICGLPKDICVCQDIAREQQRINIYSVKRKFGKIVTVIEGLDEKSIDMKELLKELKSKLACGGTAKGGHVELQGDHRPRVKDVLVDMGFSPETIDIG